MKNKKYIFFITLFLLLENIFLISSFLIPSFSLYALFEKKFLVFSLLSLSEFVLIFFSLFFEYQFKFLKNIFLEKEFKELQKISSKEIFYNRSFKEKWDSNNDNFLIFFKKDIDFYIENKWNFLFDFFNFFFRIIVCLFFVFFLEWKIALFIILLTIFSFLIIFLLNKNSLYLSERNNVNITKFQNKLIKNFSLYPLFLFFNKKDTFIQENINLVNNYEKNKNFINFKLNFKNSILFFINSTFQSCVILFSFLLVFNKNSEYFYFTFLVLINSSIFTSVNRISKIYFYIQKNKNKFNLIKDRIDKIKNIVKDRNNNFSFEKINIENLYLFSGVLINMEIKRKEKIAIIGESGIGKTEIIKTLLGYYPEKYKNIKLNNKPLKNELSFEYLRSISAFGNNVPYILDGTFDENVQIGNVSLDVNEINNIKQIFKLNHLNKNINTNSISLGEKQRINLARLYFQNKEILILDETISNVDLKTQNEILDFLLKTDKTIILISHTLDEKIRKRFDKIIDIKKEKNV